MDLITIACVFRRSLRRPYERSHSIALNLYIITAYGYKRLHSITLNLYIITAYGYNNTQHRKINLGFPSWNTWTLWFLDQERKYILRLSVGGSLYIVHLIRFYI